MSARRFTPRLRLALFLPTLIALLVAMPVSWALANGLIRQSAERHLATTLTIVEQSLGDSLSEAPGVLHRRVHALAADAEARITLIADDGRVLADSERSLEELEAMDNHSARPEISEARAAGYGSAVRHSTTLDTEFIYVARRVTHGSGPGYYLRLAEPLTASAALRHRLTLGVVLASVAALIAMGLISLWLDRELFKPLKRLVEGAGRLAGGKLDSRVEVAEAEEIGSLARTMNLLAQRVQNQVEGMAAQRERLQLITDSMADGIIVTDSDARVLAVNPALRRLFQVGGEVNGLSIREVTGLGKIKKALKRTLDTASTQTLEVEMAGPRSRTLSVTCSSLEDRSGGIVAIREVTEFLLLSEIRRDLVANVSHELKTPLTAIRGYAETLVDGALEDEKTSRLFTERILQQCVRLEAILNDLLTLSRLEQDDQELPRERVSFSRIVEEAAEVLGAIAQNRKVALALKLEPVVLVGDHQALAELCLNLMENAIKYNSAPGRVEIQLTEAAGWAELTVQDTGQGIPHEAIPRIFERFYRVDRGRSRSEGGTGLGLAIVKHAVERHDGTVEVESTLGQGSVFRVRLPLNLPAQS